MHTRMFSGSFAILLLLSACTRPVPGVLTLAPAGMRTTGTCTPHPDGTLTMSAGAAVESVAYVDAGAVTITVTAQSSSSESAASMELWFDGASVGTVRVQSTEATPFPFHVQARAGGPTAVRVVFADPSGSISTTLRLQKVVITEP